MTIMRCHSPFSFYCAVFPADGTPGEGAEDLPGMLGVLSLLSEVSLEVEGLESDELVEFDDVDLSSSYGSFSNELSVEGSLVFFFDDFLSSPSRSIRLRRLVSSGFSSTALSGMDSLYSIASRSIVFLILLLIGTSRVLAMVVLSLERSGIQ